MKSIRTEKGTELPLLNLRGKDYLQVAHRIVWFREVHPNWTIETELVSMTADSCLSQAIIKDENGRVISTAHKREDKQGFGDFIEKSETGAVGRALALCGFGTANAAELDEGQERIVDSPLPSLMKDSSYIGTFGKYKDKRIKDYPKDELLGYVEFLKKSSIEKGKPLTPPVLEFIEAVNLL